MGHVLDSIMSEFGPEPASSGNGSVHLGIKLGPGCPGYANGTASPEHMEKKKTFGELGVPIGMNPEDCLNGGKHSPVPSVAIFDEKPIHVQMCVLRAKGCNFKEIAEYTQYSEVHVRTVIAQPWAKRRVNKLMIDGLTTVNDFLSGEVMPTLEFMVALRDDTKASGSVRFSAGQELLNRFLGKPVQTTLVGKAPQSEQTIEDADKELEALQTREREILLKRPVRSVDEVRITETHITSKEVVVSSGN